MADVLKKANLFPEELVPGLIQKTKGFSALANLCAAKSVASITVGNARCRLEGRFPYQNEYIRGKSKEE